jgi:UDP:flavonoid glycosyltransferase YjiC (YdhE family)
MATQQISCFITPHGYGHATRCIAVIEALRELHPDLSVQFITTVPVSLFKETLTNFSYHPVKVDIGMVQVSALNADLPGTIAALDNFLPFQNSLLDQMSDLCRDSSLILCDIAPLGIAVAKRCNIESVLIENFTWDWIYHPFARLYPGINKHITTLQTLRQEVNHHIQTEPLCSIVDDSLKCGPIYRKSWVNRAKTRKQFDSKNRTLVLVTMGGVHQSLPNLKSLQETKEFFYLFTGQKENRRVAENIQFLSSSGSAYHPDLICAADVVICKAGYSTVAECCQAGVRVLAVAREDFAESIILQDYLKERLNAKVISPDQYVKGDWMPFLQQLIQQPVPEPEEANGAETAAHFISRILISI